MKIVFLSNYFNHHQKPLSDELYHLMGDDFCFVATSPIPEERVALGYGREEVPPYVKYHYKSEEEALVCQKLIDEADVLIHGSAPYALVEKRLKNGGLTFRYTERIYKNGCPYYRLPMHFLRNFQRHIRYSHSYMLCASAFAAADYAKTFTFLNKAYKWGYFTEVKRYGDIDTLIASKKKNSLLWAARFIEFKHPEVPLAIAKRLKRDGYEFELNMIGTGLLWDQIEKQVHDLELDDCVHLLGAMEPQRVREYMEKSELFLFTSDRGEGWGAVMNEAMNSACVPIASHAIGSVPFLVKNGENGFVYRDGAIDDLYKKVKTLMGDREKRQAMAKEAYLTMIQEWNPQNAAQRFVLLAEKLLNGEKNAFVCEEGVCSKASILHDGWFKETFRD